MNKAFWGGLCILICGGLYLLSNSIAATLPNHFQAYLEFEKDIPQIPWFIVIYNSYFILLALNFLLIKSPHTIRSLSITMMASSAIACMIFVLFPGEMGFSRTSNIEGFEVLYSNLHSLDIPHNLYPSLHITFSTLSAFAIIHQTKQKLLHYLLILWVILISFSVVLTHQHHIFDVITGFLLAWLTIKFVYLRGVKA